jgi:hypothetical protein
VRGESAFNYLKRNKISEIKTKISEELRRILGAATTIIN